MFESAQDIFTITTSGYILQNIDRLHSAILTGDGTNAAIALLTWTLPNSEVRYLSLGCSTTQSTIFTPDIPDAIGGADITVTLTTSGTCTLQLGVAGKTASIIGPSKNLVCSVTVYYTVATKNLVNRVTVYYTPVTKELVARTTVRKVTTESVVNRTTVHKSTTKELINTVDVVAL